MNGDEATSLTQKRYNRQAGLFDFWEAPIEALGFKRLRKRLWSEVHGERILEVGVGTGKNLSYHPEGSRSVAVDLSPGQCLDCRRTGGIQPQSSTPESVSVAR